MPTPEEIKKAELRLEQVTGQISNIASQQAALSAEIQKLKPELEKLRAQKEAALAELAQINANIEFKRKEIDVDLNKRSNDLSKAEQNNRDDAVLLAESWEDLRHKEEAVDFHAEQARINEAANKTLAEELNQQQTELNRKQDDLDTRLDEAAAKSVVLDENIKEAKKAIGEYQYKGESLDHQNERAVAMEKEYIDAKTELLIEMGKVNKESARLAELAETLKTQEDDVNAKLAKAEESDKVYANQLETLNDIRNELKLFQAEVNAKIQKNKIEMDLKALNL